MNEIIEIERAERPLITSNCLRAQGEAMMTTPPKATTPRQTFAAAVEAAAVEAAAVEAVAAGGAIEPTAPKESAPRRNSERANAPLATAKSTHAPARARIFGDTRKATGAGDSLGGRRPAGTQRSVAPQSPGAGHDLRATRRTPARAGKGGGQPALDARNECAAPLTIDAPGQLLDDNHADRAGGIVAQIVEQWRRRQDMQRSRLRTELAAIAQCRRMCGGDKDAGMKLWKDVQQDLAHPVRVGWLDIYLDGMAPFIAGQAKLDKLLAKLAKQLPIYGWAQSVLGLGDLWLAGLVGESGIGPGEYRSVSALWKRMGLAVIDGGRQRRVAGDMALVHGYDPSRRSLMWNVGGSLLKAQIRSEKDADGEKIAGTSYARGELGQAYLDRKAYLVEREAGKDEGWTPKHIHDDAARFMTKRLLRQVWQVWRRAKGIAEPATATPAATQFGGGRLSDEAHRNRAAPDAPGRVATATRAANAEGTIDAPGRSCPAPRNAGAGGVASHSSRTGTSGGMGMAKHRKSGHPTKSPKLRLAMKMDAEKQERKAGPHAPATAVSVRELFHGSKHDD